MLLQPALALLLPLVLAAPAPAGESDIDNAILNRMHNISEDYPDFSNATLDRDLELDDRAINTCDCASVPSTSRIVGGSEVSPKYKLPYQVMVLPCIGGGCYLCGGTIVNKRYVVTAAHCLFEGRTAITPTSGRIRVMMGEHSKCDGVTNEGGSFMTVSAVTTHPNYKAKPSGPDNDIAVLKLSEDITFDSHVKPACLPTSATKDYNGLASTISGWGGTTGYRPGVSVTQPRQCGLKEAVVKVFGPSNSKCSSFLGTSSSTIKLCAWAEGTDTCQGDSGGPLTVAEGGKYVLLGVVSYGAGCAHTTPGVYARVQGFLPWLQAIIADGECGSTPTTPAPTSTSGSLKSDNYPKNYPVGQHKTFTITGPAGMIVEVKFDSFALEAHDSCAYDYLMAMDADGSVLMKKKCGSTKPPQFTSKTNKVTILFHSDSSVTAKGFKLSWKAVGASTGLPTTGTIKSKNFPKTYPSDQDENYSVTVDAGKRIEMTFAAFNIESHAACAWDYLQIKNGDGSSLLAKTCGTSLPAKLTSKSNKATVIFHTDGSVVDKGFKITWRAV